MPIPHLSRSGSCGPVAPTCPSFWEPGPGQLCVGSPLPRTGPFSQVPGRLLLSELKFSSRQRLVSARLFLETEVAQCAVFI